jgi:hypothetical protein
MRNILLASVLLTGLLGTGAAFAAGEEVQAIKVNKGNGMAGDGNTVAMKGSPLPLKGQAGIARHGRRHECSQGIAVVPAFSARVEQKALLQCGAFSFHKPERLPLNLS